MPGSQVAMLGLLCVFCSEPIAEDVIVDHVCPDCYEERYSQCSSCDNVGTIHTSSMSSVEFRRISTVYGRDTAMRLTHMDHVAFYDDVEKYLCSDCSYLCENCGSRYGQEFNADECCEEEQELHNYSWSPNLVFHTEAGTRSRAIPFRLYMGFEVEMEHASPHVHQACEKFGENWCDPELVYFKSDGSLGWDGAEMVTQPMTLEAFRQKMPWEMIAWLHEKGARAWNRKSCGLHVHVSRSAFSASHMWKFLKFQLVNSEHCVAVAGRNSSQWASWDNDYMVEISKETSKAVKKSVYCNRYSAININPSNTIELRYFRPNMIKNGLVRVAEFVDSIYEYTKQISLREVFNGGLDWNVYMAWLAGKPEYATIRDYITNNSEEND